MTWDHTLDFIEVKVDTFHYKILLLVAYNFAK